MMSDYFEDPENEPEVPKAFERERVMIYKDKGKYHINSLDGPEIDEDGINARRRDPKYIVHVVRFRVYPKNA